MSSNKFNSVEDYLESLDSKQGNTLRGVIDVTLKNFPDLDCKLAWNVPQICRGSGYVFGVSALKRHLALAPWSANVIEAFKARLESEGYVVKKNLFQIPNDWEIDEKLLSDLVAARLAELV
ncbi:MAG: iron chaperone [Halomonas sp.]|uniref:iron chaperone n=1 Tax=unclassified Halomonas TaxID=2609666 RepID=UPI003CFAA44E